MSGLFGKRPEMPKPTVKPPSPEPPRTTEVKKDVRSELAKKRRATILNELSAEPSVLRRKLGGE